RRQRVQRTPGGELAGPLRGHLRADLAGGEQLPVVGERQLPRDVDLVAEPDRRDVRPRRRGDRRQGQPQRGQALARVHPAHAFGRLRYATSCSGLGPGITATSSQPSSPQLSRICLVAWTSSGTVAYSHFCMAAPYPPPAPVGAYVLDLGR